MELATKIMKIVVLGLAVIVALGMIVVISVGLNERPKQEEAMTIRVENECTFVTITMYKPDKDFIDAMKLNGISIEKDSLVCGPVFEAWKNTYEEGSFEPVIVAPKYKIIDGYVEVWVPKTTANYGNNMYVVSVFNGEYNHFIYPLEKTTITVEVND